MDLFSTDLDTAAKSVRQEAVESAHHDVVDFSARHKAVKSACREAMESTRHDDAESAHNTARVSSHHKVGESAHDHNHWRT